MATKPKNRPYITIEQFLSQMYQENKLSKSTLSELVGERTARRVMDGADNEMGAPTLGSTTGVVLQGQLHEYTGAVDDMKSKIADKWEQLHNRSAKPEIQKAEKTPEELSPKTSTWPQKPKP